MHIGLFDNKNNSLDSGINCSYFLSSADFYFIYFFLLIRISSVSNNLDIKSIGLSCVQNCLQKDKKSNRNTECQTQFGSRSGQTLYRA